MTSGPRSISRRKLNQPLIKTVIVFFAAAIAAIGSAITGFGAHLAFAPMLTWMFGYAPDKAQGTALRFSLAAALAAVTTGLWLASAAPHVAGSHGLSAQLGYASFHVGRGFLLTVGATVGAILAARVTPRPAASGLLRALQAIAILVAVFTVTEAAHLSSVTRSDVHYADWSAWWQIILVGAAVGALTQAARLTAGTLLVPAVYFLTGGPGGQSLSAAEAVVQSLVVVVYAGLLPLLGYVQRKLVDTTYLTAATIAGIIGGAIGGWFLGLLLERSILIFFGVVAMFFAAREVARLAATAPVLADPAGTVDPPA